MSGDGSWILPEEIECADLGGCPTPPPVEECVTLWSECDYKGVSTRICDDTPFTDFDYEV